MSAKIAAAEPAGAGQEHQRGQPDGGRDRDPQPGHDLRQRERQLDAPQQLALREAHAAAGVARLGRHALEARDHVAEDDQQRVGDERDHRRRLAAAGERQQQEEQRDARQRVEDAGDLRDRRDQPAPPVRDQRERERDREADRDRDQRQLDVLDRAASCSAPSCRRSSPGRSRCARRTTARRRARGSRAGRRITCVLPGRDVGQRLDAERAERVALVVDHAAVQRAVLRAGPRARRAASMSSAISGPPLALPSASRGTSRDAHQREPLERPVGADEVLDELVRGVQQELGGRRVLREVAADLEDRDPVAHLDRLVDVVGDEHDRLADLGLQAQELVLEALAVDRVDRAERLVHQHQRRVGGERAGDADALALAAGELRRVARAPSPAGARSGPAARARGSRSAAWSSRAASGPWRCSRRSCGAGTGRSAGSRSRSRAADRRRRGP